MEWQIIRGEPRSAVLNMQRDSELLASLAANPRPTLHLYEWESESATHGYFIRPEKWVNLSALEQAGISLARRPTGGGIIFHGFDLAFSVTVPSDHPLFSSETLLAYQQINRVVLQAIESFLGKTLQLLPTDPHPLDEASAHFCMAKPTIYDVMLSGGKVGGAAQRRTKFGLLHQGSIALMPPPQNFFERILLPDTRVAHAMARHGYYLLEDSPRSLAAAKQELARLLVDGFQSSDTIVDKRSLNRPPL